ncbi:LytTR family transcriptional regulator [Pseudomonas phage vB_PcuM_ KLEP17-4]|nr:LytTR family transcriptional regulator [Pseudomonas phage vB_PcuM_ KLEP17-4]
MAAPPASTGAHQMTQTIHTTYKGQSLEIDVSTITHFSSGDKYVTAHCQGKEVLLSWSLDSLGIVYADQFVRTHRSWLVRRSHIVKIKRGPDREYYATLIGGQVVPVSRRRRDEVRPVLGVER